MLLKYMLMTMEISERVIAYDCYTYFLAKKSYMDALV